MLLAYSQRGAVQSLRVITFERIAVALAIIGGDIGAGLPNMVGGEIVECTKLREESREQSIDRMIADAAAQGANGIVELRFTTAQIMEHAAELLAYGTAVIVEDER